MSIAANATVTLFNATISYSGWEDGNGITCLGDATIILKGDNSVTPNKQTADAICLAEGSTLTIEGNGKLTAKSGSRGVGIGNRIWNAQSPSNIIINGGTIIATGYYTGIGCGHNGDKFGNITINGGTVTAIGETGPGIGAGFGSSCGNITITNGVTSVTATKGSGAYNSIGKGESYSGSCGTITIGGTVYPDGITDSPYTYVPSAAPTAYTLAESTKGMIVGTDGKAYDVADKDNLPSGVTAAGVVVYKNGANGLAIALTDEASMMDWATACGESGAAAHTPTVSGCSWKLPSQEEWTLVKNANSGTSLNSAITSAGGTAIPTYSFMLNPTAKYWLSTESDSDIARIWAINGYDEIAVDQDLKTSNNLVRACLAW